MTTRVLALTCAAVMTSAAILRAEPAAQAPADPALPVSLLSRLDVALASAERADGDEPAGRSSSAGSQTTFDWAAQGRACEGCPPLTELMDRYERAGGRFLVCPICVQAKKLDSGNFVANAEVGGTVVLWDWIGEGATTFSY